jgi:hypothetical protein
LTYPSDRQSDFPALPFDEQMISLHSEIEPTGRLVVLIPAEADYPLVTKRIWKLAMETGMQIQMIGLCKDLVQEPSLRRGLVTMSALIEDGRVHAQAKVEIGTSWAEAVKHNLQAGDMIVCFAEQRAGLLHRPLSQILQANLKVPVYVISGLAPRVSSRSNWLSQIFAWGGSLGIIIGSSVLQFQITSLPQGWAQSAVMILSFIGEIWLIWGWNSLFG